MWIVDRSKQAAENGEVWRPEDHLALVYHLKQIDSMAQALVELEIETDEEWRKRVIRTRAKLAMDEIAFLRRVAE